MAEKSIFLDHVGDSPQMRILQHFVEGREFEFTLTDLLGAHVSWGTINVIVPKLEKLGIIKQTRRVGRARLYKINNQHRCAQLLTDIYDSVILESLDRRQKKATVAAKNITDENEPELRPNFFEKIKIITKQKNTPVSDFSKKYSVNAK